MDTKKKILDAALTLFSEKGYANVFVAEIAEKVGIRAPSLYKHYKSKRMIFDAILEEMKRSYDGQAAMLRINGNDPAADAGRFAAISEDGLVEMGVSLFRFFLHDGSFHIFSQHQYKAFHPAPLHGMPASVPSMHQNVSCFP